MSLDSTGAYEQRLLPAAVEDRLVGWFGRSGGIALLAVTAALWAAVITWSIADPSLTHATGGVAGNALGIPGAIASDLMLQTLGLGALIALLPPMLWALELIGAQRIRDFRAKASFYPLAVLILAGGLSSLPVAAGWPLNHGYGGILGDLVHGLAAAAFGILNPERGSLAGGVVLVAGGGAALLTAIGAELKDLARIVERRSRRGRDADDATAIPDRYFTPVPAVAASPTRRRARDLLAAWPFLRGGRRSEVAGAYHASAPFADGWTAHGPAHPPADIAAHAPASWPAHWPAHWQTPVPAEQGVHVPPPGYGYAPHPRHQVHPAHFGPGHPAIAGEPMVFPNPAPLPGSRADWGDPRVEAAGRDAPLDDGTDAASRSIAERFAPAGTPRPAPRADVAPPAAAAHAGPHGSPTAGPQAGHRAAAPVPRKLGPGLLAGMSFRRAEPQYKRPSLNLLRRPPGQKLAQDHTPAMQRGTARLLEDVLADFGVKGEIKDIRPGPVVTLFEFEPARGTKSSRVIGLADDIARSMSATAVRVAIVPGRNAIGIELPNARRETVLLRELLEAEAFRTADAALPITLGKSIGGEPIVADLARMPHLLVAGTTGSGKSVGVNTMILSLLFRHAPEDCRFLMIDPKMLELSVYNGIPHLLTPVVTDPQKAVAALEWAVREMEERYKRMSQLAVRNIEVFNNRVRNAKKRGEMMSRTVQTGFDARSGQPLFEEEKLALEPLPYIVVVVDEFADLMVVAGKEIEAAVQRLAQMARAAGIHLIMATQRPSVDIVTGTIKANFPTRISFKVASKIDSRTILNDQGAEQLLGQGDMLYAGSAGGAPTRVHGAFVADDEVEAIVAFLKSQGTPRYVEGVTDAPPDAGPSGGGDGGGSGAQGSEDDLYDRAVAVVLRDGKASTSYVQRRLSIGYNRAADLIERMEREGLISPANSVGKREILAGRDASGSHAA